MQKSAVVIGGGAAGASAAFRLKQAGVAVRLIERGDRVGGRTRTEHIDGYIVDVGAGLLPGTYKAVYRLMHDAGLDHLVEALRSPTAFVRGSELNYLDPGHALRDLASTRLLSTRSKFGLLKILLHAPRMWKKLGFENLGLAAPFDIETVSAYASRELGDESLEYLVGPIVKTMYSGSPSEMSVIDFFWCVRNLMSPDAFCIRGGMDRMVAGVADQLDVCVQTEATDVVQEGEMVKVTLRDAAGREAVEEVDCCVIATRARDVPQIYKGLDVAAGQYLGNLEYSQTTDLHLRLRERPSEKAVVIMVPDSADPDVCAILFQHNKGSDRVPAGKGAISIYFHHRFGSETSKLPDNEYFERAIAKVERLLPGVRQIVEGYHVQRWDFTATKSYPGYYQELADFTRRVDFDSRVQLAGDYFAMACVNTAVTSGESAAKRLIGRYL
jgi:oxygen-dependent protoporphyrinogen oxidase